MSNVNEASSQGTLSGARKRWLAIVMVLRHVDRDDGLGASCNATEDTAAGAH